MDVNRLISTERQFFLPCYINVIAAERDIHSSKAVCKICLDVKILRKQTASQIFLCKCISRLFKNIYVKFYVYMTPTFKVMSSCFSLTKKF